MKKHILIPSVALLLAAFLWGCQEQASSPVGPEGPGIILLNQTGVDFDGSVYELVETPLNWFAANAAARRMVAPGCRRAHLATITSQDEQDVLTELMAHLPEEGPNAWIGGLQGGRSPEENWHWVTGERWVYTNWTLNEPNDDAGPGSEQHLEALVAAPDIGRAAGVWNDAPGFEEKYFVVESEHCN